MKLAQEQQSKFEGEDVEEVIAAKKPTTQKPPTPKKEGPKYKDKGAVAVVEEPLDDPVAEKLRQQK